MKIKKIVVSVPGKGDIELTLEEARQLRDLLNKTLGSQAALVPVPIPVPVSPQPPLRWPYRHDPWTTTPVSNTYDPDIMRWSVGG